MLPASVAHATFPGRNGHLAIGVTHCLDVRSIVWVRPDGTGRRLIAGCRRESALVDEPEWLRDGRSLRVSRNGALAVMAADGSNRRLLRPDFAFRYGPA